MKTFFKARLNTGLIRYHFKKLRALMFVFTILLATTFPVPIFIRAINQGSDLINYRVEPSLYVLLFIAMFLFAIVPFIFFNYLFSSVAVDTFHALPLKRRDLFLTYNFASILFMLIPFTLVYFLGYGMAYTMLNVPFNSMHIFNYFKLCVVLIMITNLSIFVIMNTGTLSDGIIYTGILTIAPFIAYIAIQFFAQRYLLGFGFGSLDILALISPHFALFDIITGSGLYYDSSIVASFWFLIALVFAVISISIYETRQSEKTEQPFTNNVFFIIITSLFTGILLVGLISLWASFYDYDTSLFAPRVIVLPVLIAFVIYVLLNIIKNRSARDIRDITRKYVLVAGVTLILCIVIVNSKGFGFEQRVPRKENIAKVKITSLQNAQGLPQSTDSLFVDDTENIEAIVNLHEQILEQNKKDPSLVTSVNTYNLRDKTTITIEYELRNKARIVRSYAVDYKLLYNIYSLPNETALDAQIKPILSHSVALNTGTPRVFDGTFSNPSIFNGNQSDLVAAYHEDIKNFDAEDFKTKGTDLTYIIVYEYNKEVYHLSIDSRFDRVNQYLASHTSPASSDDSELNYSYYQLDAAKGVENDAAHGLLKFNMYSDAYYEIDAQSLNQAELKQFLGKTVAFNYSQSLNDVLHVEGAIFDLGYMSLYIPIK